MDSTSILQIVIEWAIWLGWILLYGIGALVVLVIFTFVLMALEYVKLKLSNYTEYSAAHNKYEYSWTSPQSSDAEIHAAINEYAAVIHERNGWRRILHKLILESSSVYEIKRTEQLSSLIKQVITVPKENWLREEMSKCVSALEAKPTSIELHNELISLAEYAIAHEVYNPNTSTNWETDDIPTVILNATSVKRQLTLDLLLEKQIITKKEHDRHDKLAKKYPNTYE
jgi:hypothetical protein